MKNRNLVFIVLTVFSSLHAHAQRIPDSSVTGTARATVGIDPKRLNPTGDPGTTANGAINTAYEPSWTVLIGKSDQTVLPRKATFPFGIELSILADGNLTLKSSYRTALCYGSMFGGVATHADTKNLGIATGSKSLTTQLYGDSGAAIDASFCDGGAAGMAGATALNVTLTPVISATGALIGISYNINPRDYPSLYWWSSYQNPSLSPITTVTSTWSMCNTNNACRVESTGTTTWKLN